MADAAKKPGVRWRQDEQKHWNDGDEYDSILS